VRLWASLQEPFCWLCPVAIRTDQTVSSAAKVDMAALTGMLLGRAYSLDNGVETRSTVQVPGSIRFNAPYTVENTTQ